MSCNILHNFLTRVCLILCRCFFLQPALPSFLPHNLWYFVFSHFCFQTVSVSNSLKNVVHHLWEFLLNGFSPSHTKQQPSSGSGPVPGEPAWLLSPAPALSPPHCPAPARLLLRAQRGPWQSSCIASALLGVFFTQSFPFFPFWS